MVLQSVQGTRSVNIFPYLRKIDLMSSNSYILSSPDQISLIDPGGLEEQISRLDIEIALLQEERPRPLVVYLTHVHIDHWYQFQQKKDFPSLRQDLRDRDRRARRHVGSRLPVGASRGRAVRLPDDPR